MRFRQVHLDFHTSEAIPDIGADFSKEQFQAMLIEGHVDSITVFSKCHHGWAYHPSEANEQHPGLKFDLLGAMIEAAHEIDVKTPVYLSAGLDEKLARRHPEWLIRSEDDRTGWVDSFLKPGFHEFCMNTPYLEILLNQIKEVVTRYDADGIFLDIVNVRTCYCHNCLNELRGHGLDPRDKTVVKALGEKTYENYTARVRETVHAIKPGMAIFHNGGHIRRGRRDLAAMNTHLEVESLPTGGWGYDHFPLSARYVQPLGMPFLGMTGKFHTSWGEFGGYKHPNALRYETSLSLASSAACSVGDQLHPRGLMDPATYALIGEAYKEVEEKEAWCTDTRNVADVALLSLEAVDIGQAAGSGASDAGAVRILLEGNILFDVIDIESDFHSYKVIILPDEVLLTSELQSRLQTYLSNGGKILATGQSGLSSNRDRFGIDLGVKWLGVNEFMPDYIRPRFELQSLKNASFIMYGQGQRVELDGGIELADREDPYFNRDALAFCSHQHTPTSQRSGGPGMVESANGIYIAWNVFDDYATKGSLAVKEIVLFALNRLLSSGKTLETDLPAQGIVTLQWQPKDNRYIHHLLYASPVRRGNGIEIIEDILPISNVKAALRIPVAVKSIYLAPQRTKLAFEEKDGIVRYSVPSVECHQMVVIEV